jgi:conjugal transfer pilus assembly protein TraV
MRSKVQRRMIAGLAGTVVLGALVGCATLGGNVKGNFQCNAPSGICAPTSAIDDQALAQIGANDDGANRGNPAIHYRPKSGGRPSVAAATQGTRGMRIVLPGRTDRFGRWREPQIVYADIAFASDEQVSGQGTPTRLSLSELASGAPALASAQPIRHQAMVPPEAFDTSVKQAYANGLGAPVAGSAPRANRATENIKPSANDGTSPAPAVAKVQTVSVSAPAFPAPNGDDD